MDDKSPLKGRGQWSAVVELKSSGDDNEVPKAPRLRRRVLHGVHNRNGEIPPSAPVI